MLRVYDQNKNLTGYITKIKDLCIESDLSSGDKTLSFEYCAKKGKEIKNEYYIETKTDRYVVKDIDMASDGYPSYQCQLDLEDLESCMHEKFSSVNATLTDAARLALAGTGWTVETDIEKKRSVSAMKATPYTILGRIRDAWMCEMRFDTKKKVVYFQEKFGEDKGVYLISGLNLKRLKFTGDTYDFYTRIIPIGKDGLKITDINNGKEYVENYQYSNKIRTLIWEDTSYEDAEELKKDAEAKLDDLSKPKKTFSADVVDLAKQNTQYKILEYGLGDTVLLADEPTEIREKQRIVKMKEYPQNPEKNSCELSNTTLTFEEQQAKLEAAAAAFDNLTNADGTVKGVLVRGVEADGVVGIEVVINNSSTFIKLGDKVSDLNQDLTNVKGDISQVSSDLEYTKARLGTVETTYIKATEGAIGSAYIKDGSITNVKIAEATIEASKIKSINADVINAGTIRTDRLIITGPDGQDSIVKAINIANGISEAEVNGTKIQAASIDVVDLAAFHAKLAQFEVSMNAIYSGKTSITDPVSGIYLATTGIGVGNGALAGINESPVQIYSEGSMKLKGRNALLDFNTVLGELNIEATSIKIKSKAVATTGDIDGLKKDLDAYQAASAEFQQNVDGWKFVWSTLISTDDADPDNYQKYITLKNGNITLGNSKSNVKLNLTNALINYTDTDGKELARFAKDAIYLGMESTETVIDLCNGSGTIKNANPGDSQYKRLAIESTDSVEISAARIAKISAASGEISATIGMNVSDVPWDTTYDDSVENGSIILRSTNKKIEYESVFKLHPGGFQYNDGRGTIESLAGQLTIGMNVLMMGTVVQIPAGTLHVNGNIGTAGNILLTNGGTIQAKDTSNIDRAILGLSRSNQVLVGYGTYAAKADSDTIVCAGSKLIFQLGKLNAAWKPYYTAGDTITIGNLGSGGWITNNKTEVHFCIPIDRPILGAVVVNVIAVNGLVVRQAGKYLYGSSSTAYAVPSSLRAVYGAGYLHVTATFGNTTNVTNNNDACGIQASLKVIFG